MYPGRDVHGYEPHLSLPAVRGTLALLIPIEKVDLKWEGGRPCEPNFPATSLKDEVASI